jgi:starch phosphorylase
LLLRDLPRLERMLADDARPIQFLFAGKAHPRDDAGKDLIRHVTELTRDPKWGRRIVFLENYDMAVARYLVQGVDVWLNTPLRPNEASGTSGMKAAANGALNLSTLDGWFDEVWAAPANPHTIGWAIGKGEAYSDPAYQDQVESEALYDLLERDVIPTFYQRGGDRLPRKWIERMKDSIGSLCHFVNTHRMVGDYVRKFYLETHRRFRALDEGGAARSRALAAWLERVRREWPGVRVGSIERGAGATLPVRSLLRIAATVQLGKLTPEDVVVELYMGRLDADGAFLEAAPSPMRLAGAREPGVYAFEVEAPCAHSGLHGYTVRIRARHPDLPAGAAPGLICWAEAR